MIYSISVTMMNLWGRVAVFDLSCEQISGDVLVLSFKAQKLSELKEIQEEKGYIKGINKGS